MNQSELARLKKIESQLAEAIKIFKSGRIGMAVKIVVHAKYEVGTLIRPHQPLPPQTA